jgi:hypothetical protein
MTPIRKVVDSIETYRIQQLEKLRENYNQQSQRIRSVNSEMIFSGSGSCFGYCMKCVNKSTPQELCAANSPFIPEITTRYKLFREILLNRIYFIL